VLPWEQPRERWWSQNSCPGMDLMEHIPKPGYHELQQQKEKDTTARNVYKSCIGIVVCMGKTTLQFSSKTAKI